MTRDAPAPVIKWLTIAVALIWLSAMGWSQFSGYTLPYRLQQQYVQKKAGNCKGSFSNRYDCKLGIRITAGRQSFAILGGKIFLVFAPPILMGLAFTRVSRRMWREAEAERQRHHRQRRAQKAADKASQSSVPQAS